MRLSERLERRPGRLVVGFALLQLVGWSLLPALVQPNLPLDVIEGLAWGREWQLGYAKHPPLQAWLLEATARLFGARNWPMYLLSQLAVVAAFAAVWALAHDLTDRTGAALSVLALAGIYYFSIPTPEFNPNVLQMPIWAGLCLVLYRALVRQRLWYWLVLGALAAAGLYAKYFTGLLLAVLALILVLEPSARRCLTRPGPYLALAVAGLLLAPHLRWLATHDFLPFAYAAGRAGDGGGALDHLLYPLRFGAAQVADHAGLILLLAIGRWGLWRGGDVPALAVAPVEQGFPRRFLAAVALGPLVLAMLISGLAGIKFQSMWGAPMFCFSGLFCVGFLRPVLAQARLRQLAVCWCLLFLGGLAYLGLAKPLAPYLEGEASRHHYPGPATAAHFTAEWRARFGRPLAIVVGDAWTAGNVAFYSPDRPSVFIEGDLERGFWIRPDELTRAGALVVWRVSRDGAAPPERLRRHLPGVIPQPPVDFPWRTGAELEPLRLGWAVVPPVPD